jgi:hypothetical protein
MLAEVRSRAVDVDTSVEPRAMLPVEPSGMAGGGRRQREALTARSAATQAVALIPVDRDAALQLGKFGAPRHSAARIASPSNGEIA